MIDSDARNYGTGFSTFDDLFGPMESGSLYMIAGRTVLNRHLIDRAAVLAAHGGGTVYYIDGGHRADPFSMARILRMHREDPRPVLERVMIARAFTAYQMDSLIRDSLHRLGSVPDLLIVSSMDSLFSDPEVDLEAARAMVRNCMKALRGIADRGACVLLSVSGGSRESELLPHMSPYCSNWASLTPRLGSRVRIVTRGGEWRDFSPLHPFQTMIEDFGSPPGAEEAA
ncbi:MAG: hypothetical protein ACMUIE_08685 [Thermoplasmatota archaeon]